MSPLESAQALQRKANEHRANENLAAALENYHAAIQADASYMPARLGAGLVHLDQGSYRLAQDCFGAAHRLQPNAVDPLYFLAQSDESLGELAQALARYQQALDINPAFLPALRAIAPLAVRLGRVEVAENCLKRAILVSPEDVEFHLLLGITLYASGRHKESVAEFDLVLGTNPQRLEALINKAEALCSLERFAEARLLTDQLSVLAPHGPEVLLVTARVLFNAGSVEEAAVKAKELLAVDPKAAMGEFILGLVHWSRTDGASARHHWQRALTLDPDLSAAALGIATILFFERDYRRAWDAYEARFGSSFGSVSVDSLLLRRLANGRRWTGDADPEGKLYIWAEQGFGDTLMLLPAVAIAQQCFGGAVYFFCPPELQRLAEQIVAPGFVLSSRSDIPDDALHCPLYSLPSVFQRTAQRAFEPKARAAYLKAPEAAIAKFRNRLAQLRGFRIGVVWDGNAGYKANLLRSVPLVLFSEIAQLAGVTMVSLQKNPPAADLATCPLGLADWTSDINDFGDTAAIMQGLDLVISIDSGPAHLAGALGVPVWLLNRYGGEWRWGRDRSDNDWYQSMRVFYQQTRADWAPVFRDMALQLKQQLSSS